MFANRFFGGGDWSGQNAQNIEVQTQLQDIRTQMQNNQNSNLLKDENSCIKYAHMSASDIDGYEGMIFSRWLADVMGKPIKIDWQKFT